MASRLAFTDAADREWAGLSRRLRRRLRPAIWALGVDPRPAAAVLMWGEWDGYWRLRIGEYRVIYEIDDKAERVRIVRVCHRSQAYEQPEHS